MLTVGTGFISVLSATNDSALIAVSTVLSIVLLSITLAMFKEPRLQLISCPHSFFPPYPSISEGVWYWNISQHKLDILIIPTSFNVCSLLAVSMYTTYGYPLSCCIWAILVNICLGFISFFRISLSLTNLSYHSSISISSRETPYFLYTVWG